MLTIFRRNGLWHPSCPLGFAQREGSTLANTVKWTLTLCVSLTLVSGLALANPLPVGSTTMNFTDGSTATGNFQLDPTTNTLTSWVFQLGASLNGVFGADTYNSTDPANTAAPTSLVVSNFNGDEVLSFEENIGTERDEFDIVVACGGVANCLTQATTGMSFAIVSGPTACPPPGQAGFCIESGEQLGVPESLEQRLLSPGFLNVTDPNGALAFNVDNVATGTLFGSGSTGGGGGGSVPEPGSLTSLLGAGMIALIGAKCRRKAMAGK